MSEERNVGQDLQNLLLEAQKVLPSSGELGMFRRVIENFAIKAAPYLDWQDTGTGQALEDDADFAPLAPKDRPFLAMESWDEPPVIIYWDAEEQCYQYSDQSVSDNIGVCEEFVKWAELLDIRFHTPTVQRARAIEGVKETEDRYEQD